MTSGVFVPTDSAAIAQSIPIERSGSTPKFAPGEITVQDTVDSRQPVSATTQIPETNPISTFTSSSFMSDSAFSTAPAPTYSSGFTPSTQDASALGRVVVDDAKRTVDQAVNSEANRMADGVVTPVYNTAGAFLQQSASQIGSVATDVGGLFFGGIIGNAAETVASGLSSLLVDSIESSDLMRKIRSFSLFGSSSSSSITGSWNNSGQDWRVRLSIPTAGAFRSSQLLAPLYETDNSMVWPFTPNIIVTNSANYNSLSPTHNNYTYPAYENSAIEQITITGEFSVENGQDALYWVAANHYLRSVTKMSYGNSSNQGAPPPVVKLNGYGDFVFNNVPVVVENFMINLPKDVDYIRAEVGPNGSYVPVLSEISVTVRVAYSRESVNQFSLDTFVQGGYLSGSLGFI